MSKKVQRSVEASHKLVGSTIRMLDGTERRITGLASPYRYRVAGIRMCIIACYVKYVKDNMYEQVTMDYANSARNIIDCGGFAHFQFGDDDPAMATQNDLSTLLVGSEDTLPSGAAAETQRFVVGLIEKHMFASTAAQGSARVSATASKRGDDTIIVTIEIDLEASMKVANMTADGAFAALQCEGRTIGELRRMSDDELMDAYCVLLKSTN